MGESQNLIVSLLSIFFASGIVVSLNRGVLLILSLLIPLYMIAYYIFKNPLYKLQYKSSEEYSSYYASVEQVFANMKIIKMHQWYDNFLKKISQSFSSVHSSSMENAKIGYVFSNVDAIIRYMANLAIFIYAGVQIIDKRMTVGEFTMINAYSLTIISSLSSVMCFGKRHRQASVSYDRINAIYQETEEPCGTEHIDNVSEIVVEDLFFYYGTRPVLTDIGFTLQKGKIYSVIGDNGSGKSTLISILSGLEQDYKGTIKYDGIDMRLLDHRYLRRNLISILEQEPSLIHSTVKHDSAMPETKKQMVDVWSSRLGADEGFAVTEQIGEDVGSNIIPNVSGGEKQKIALIRALSKDAPVLILDEPNSAFDSEGTVQLCEILQHIKQEKIVIVVTHREELINISDEIIAL